MGLASLLTQLRRSFTVDTDASISKPKAVRAPAAAEDFTGLYTKPPTSSATKFPGVPAPDVALAPSLLAARWVSHDLYGEEMPGIAADLLEAGFDTPAVRRLAGETQVNNSADAEPLVSRMFRELGIPPSLGQQEAKLIVSRQLAREVIAGWRNAWATASHLEIVIWEHLPPNADLSAIFQINGEIDWDAPYRRSLPDLSAALLEAFADLGTMAIEDVDVSHA
ncbi:hypothetical protein [Granulicella tundricola]|uniref:Uncharacterized protein n=1 Tax=Granulicella tundricola (strain ATCC BAA-1859 / DSM 23138 / MP5ACTX9) TaxID=1198114 RepID=E8X818_GRATM|nr:hypothetical protein [Granulicella tundricola]ADW71602.1 hypothetical protein AciX9_4673 [Granulicella tundricola MP5ACTX9]